MHDNMAAFLPAPAPCAPAARLALLARQCSAAIFARRKKGESVAPKVGANACFWNWR